MKPKRYHVWVTYDHWLLKRIDWLIMKYLLKLDDDRMFDNFGWAMAMPWGTHVWYNNPKDDISIIHHNHELIHAAQQARDGWFSFFWNYYWVERKIKYDEKTYEVEAYENAHNLSYLAVVYPWLTLVEHE